MAMDTNGNGDGNGKGGGGNAAAPLNDGAAEKDIPQCVQVAVHIRPLIGFERAQGCKDCITVVPGQPQVQIGTHSFTFDHVYGSTASPSSAIFEECVGPLVDGLFQGYNATVLAYGQTGSGKTYTMGTGYTLGGNTEGIIPLVMEAIYKKVKELKDQGEILLKVSFIEILKEEVHDLLDPNPLAVAKPDGPGGGKPPLHVKAPIQIRETANGGITLTGVTEIDVTTQEEMASVLAQGSLSRATGSTNMNNQSSRSHAIFTINMVNKRKWDTALSGDPGSAEDRCEDFVCAKLHLVDLAGSERAKRTGADGLRFKEGVHINKGLLALGNVISALGDEKKRKEGGHVPYRDSKLTRLLQDSLGGNSRTVMIACVSPADTNAEETLNTLKYANRARNIQNKAIINRDPAVAEMQRMRNQLEYLQAELLCYRAGGVSSDELQVLKHKIAWLEASNAELRQELRECRESSQLLEERVMDAQILKDKLCMKMEQSRNGKTWKEIDDDDDSQDVDLIKGYLSKIQELENEVQRLQTMNSQTTRSTRSSTCVDRLDIENNALVSSHEAFTDIAELQAIDVGGEESREGEEDEAAKELEHSFLQDEMGKELQELDKRLEQKEAEMKLFNKTDTTMLKQHYEKKFMELEEEKKALLKEMDRLKSELENISHTTDENTQNIQEGYLHKLKALESQIAELKKKQENQAQLLKQKQKSDEAAKRLQEEIQRIKTHKVQLQHKMKQESEQFRHWKASREKELLQLKKEGRRNEFEMHKLQALNQRQKMVLQRKTEEAAMATKRLKELLETRKPLRDATGTASGNGSVQSNEKALQHSIEHELEVAVRVHEVRSEYEKQTEARAAMAKELAKLKQESETSNGTPSMSPSARHSRIGLLETMLNTSSSTLVAMASQLSEAEERERAFSGRGRWNQLRSMGDAKSLLSFLFNTAAYSRCQLRDKELEIRERKESIRELSSLLRQSETQRKELEKQKLFKEQVGSDNPTKRKTHVRSTGSYSMGSAASKQLQNGIKFSDVSNISNTGNENFPYDLRKASRGAQSYNYAHSDEIDILEGEDMDISDGDQSYEESDEDWAEDEDWEKHTMKKNRVSLVAGERARAPKAGSKPLDRKSSGSLVNEEQDSGSTSHFSGEILCGENENKSKSSETEGCCSCGINSGCKTKKCECKAAGSFCGPKCGCKTNKCSNRETPDTEAGLSTVDGAVQNEVAEAVETLRMEKARRQNHDRDEGGNTDADDLIEMEVKAKAAEQLLAVHGAALLQNALKEKLLSHEMQVGSNTKEEGEVEQKGPQRRPLTDIGNTKITSHDQGNAKANRRKKWQKSLIQLVPVAPQSNAQPQEPASATSTTKVVATGTSVTNVSNVSRPSSTEEPLSTSIQEVSIPLKLPRIMHKNASSVTSPLKARNAGASEEGGGDKFGNGPGSPGRCARGLNGKENMRSN